MQSSKITPEHADAVRQEAKAPDEEKRRRIAETDMATRPSSGASIPQAIAGASLSGEARGLESGETADALKRAAENDTRP